MDIIGVIGIFVALAILIYFSMKNIPLFPLCVAAIFVVALTNGINLWTAFSDYFLTGAFNALKSFLLVLSAATIYSKVMDYSGSTQSIAWWCIGKFGKKNAVVVIIVMGLILSLSGMNGMMMAVALYSIVCMLLKEANLPRHLSVALILFTGNFGDGFWFASTHVNNIVPGQFLGTKMTAAAGFGIYCGILCLIFASIYMYFEVKRVRRKGEVWTYPENADMSIYEAKENVEDMPSAFKAFLPMIVLTVMVLALSYIGANSSMTAVVSLLVAAVLSLILNANIILKKKKVNIPNMVHECLESTVTTMAPFIFLLGFGEVVSHTQGYNAIVEWVIGAEMSPYWKAAFSTSVLSGVMASGAGGIRMTLSALSEYYLASGASVDIIARISTMASTVFDTLPHCGAIYVMFNIYDVKHKEGYRNCFMLTDANTMLCTVIGIITVTLLGM